MPALTLARSKSASDLRKFKDLMATGHSLEYKGLATKARVYFEAALAMVHAKKIYFVGA